MYLNRTPAQSGRQASQMASPSVRKKMKEDAASKNVADILYQMISDERKYGLDAQTAKILDDAHNK